jgi:hypothetical protein
MDRPSDTSPQPAMHSSILQLQLYEPRPHGCWISFRFRNPLGLKCIVRRPSVVGSQTRKFLANLQNRFILTSLLALVFIIFHAAFWTLFFAQRRNRTLALEVVADICNYLNYTNQTGDAAFCCELGSEPPSPCGYRWTEMPSHATI